MFAKICLWWINLDNKKEKGDLPKHEWTFLLPWVDGICLFVSKGVVTTLKPTALSPSLSWLSINGWEDRVFSCVWVSGHGDSLGPPREEYVALGWCFRKGRWLSPTFRVDASSVIIEDFSGASGEWYATFSIRSSLPTPNSLIKVLVTHMIGLEQAKQLNWQH